MFVKRTYTNATDESAAAASVSSNLARLMAHSSEPDKLDSMHEIDEEDDLMLPLRHAKMARTERTAPTRSDVAPKPTKPEPPTDVQQPASDEFGGLKTAAFYKNKQLAERKLRSNVAYIESLVTKAINANETTMTIQVPIGIMSHEPTVGKLVELKFEVSPKPVSAVCYCGAPQGECEATRTGMPTDACSPPMFRVSWLNAA